MAHPFDVVVLRGRDDFALHQQDVMPYCETAPRTSFDWYHDFKLSLMRPLTKISLFGVRLATCVLAVYWVLLFTGTHIPTIPSFAPRMWDKAQHFGAFFGLAMLLCWVIPTRRSPWRKFLTVAAIAMLYAAFDELTQGFVRGRSTDIRDFAADTLGTWSAIGIYAFCRWLNLDPERVLPRIPAVATANRVENYKSLNRQAPVIVPDDQTSCPRAMSADHDSINVA